MGISSTITMISAATIKQALLDQGFLNEQDDFTFHEMEGGVCSSLFWVTRNGEDFVLKQPLTYFRGEEKFETDNETFFYRNIAEQRFIRFANTIADGDILPKLALSCEKDYYFIMTAAAKGSEKWKDVLLRGEVDAGIGEAIGKFVAKLQNATARNEALMQQFTNPYLPTPTFAFYFSRIHPCHEAVMEAIPEVKDEVQRVIDSSQPRREALCTFDINPKNIMVRGSVFMMLDHEGAQFGDPSFDVGMTLAHFMLKAVHNRHIFSAYANLAERFWNSYRSNSTAWDIKEFEQRMLEHAFIMMMARAFGKLPVDYLTADDKASIRQAGVKALQSRLARFDDAIDLIRTEAR